MAKEVSELINQLGARECRGAGIHDNHVVACWQTGDLGGNHATELAADAIPYNGPLGNLRTDHESKPGGGVRPSDAQLKRRNTAAFSAAQDTDNVPVSL
jgi:hypothetical protein